MKYFCKMNVAEKYLPLYMLDFQGFTFFTDRGRGGAERVRVMWRKPLILKKEKITPIFPKKEKF